MAEPFSLGALGALAATEGIKFLYEQAKEILLRWRARKEGREAEAEAPIQLEHEDVLNGTLAPPKVNFDAAERLRVSLEQFADILASYAEGKPVDLADSQLAQTADGLRKALEVIYSQRITFKGEQRQASGPMVIASADVDNVIGYAAVIRSRLIKSGRVEATLTAKEVSGVAVAIETDTIG